MAYQMHYDDGDDDWQALMRQNARIDYASTRAQFLCTVLGATMCVCNSARQLRNWVGLAAAACAAFVLSASDSVMLAKLHMWLRRLPRCMQTALL